MILRAQPAGHEVLRRALREQMAMHGRSLYDRKG